MAKNLTKDEKTELLENKYNSSYDPGLDEFKTEYVFSIKVGREFSTNRFAYSARANDESCPGASGSINFYERLT